MEKKAKAAAKRASRLKRKQGADTSQSMPSGIDDSQPPDQPDHSESSQNATDEHHD